MSTLKMLMDLPTEKKIKEGLIAGSWVNAAEIYDMYLQSKTSTGGTDTQICIDIADKIKQSESTVRHSVYKIRAILK